MNKTGESNGVTKRFIGDKIIYYFPIAVITVNSGNGQIQIRALPDLQLTDSFLFADQTETYGTSSAEALIDEYARRRFFFDLNSLAIQSSASGQTEAMTQFEKKQLAYLTNLGQLLKEIKIILTSIAN